MKLGYIMMMALALFTLNACGGAWEAPIETHGEKAILEVYDATDGDAVFTQVEWICMLHDDEDIDDEMCVFFITYERDEEPLHMLVITSEPAGTPGLVAQRATISDGEVLDAARKEMLLDIEEADTPIRHDTGTLESDTIEAWIEARE